MIDDRMPLTRLKPAVPKHWLMAIAGGVWLAVGVMLLATAWGWVQHLPGLHIGAFLAAGLLLALLFNRFMLRRIVRRNVIRIGNYADRGCVFAFQAWRSYFVVLAMIAMGAVLRHTPLPREALAVFYTAMGGALCLSSPTYFAHFRDIRTNRCPPSSGEASEPARRRKG